MSYQWRKGLPVNLSAMDSLVLEYMTSEGLVDTCGCNGPAQATNQVQIDLSNFVRPVLPWAGFTPMPVHVFLLYLGRGLAGLHVASLPVKMFQTSSGKIPYRFQTESAPDAGTAAGKTPVQARSLSCREKRNRVWQCPGGHLHS